MGSEWQSATLGDISTTRNGAGIKQAHFATSGVPLARVSNFTTDSIDLSGCGFVSRDHALLWKDHQIKQGDVLIATVGSMPPNWSSVVGKVIRAPKGAEGAIQNQNTCCVRAIDGIADQTFLYYALRSREFIDFAVNVAAGSANQARLPPCQRS